MLWIALTPVLAGLVVLVWVATSLRGDRLEAEGVAALARSQATAPSPPADAEFSDPQVAKTLYLGLRADFAEHLRYSADQVAILQSQTQLAERKIRMMERELKYLRAEVAEAEAKGRYGAPELQDNALPQGSGQFALGPLSTT
jgi:hypothetical protein